MGSCPQDMSPISGANLSSHKTSRESRQVPRLRDHAHLEHKWKGHCPHVGAGLLLPRKTPPHGWSLVAADSLMGLGACVQHSDSSLSTLACVAPTPRLPCSVQFSCSRGLTGSQEGMWMHSHAEPPRGTAGSLGLGLTQEYPQC